MNCREWKESTKKLYDNKKGEDRRMKANVKEMMRKEVGLAKAYRRKTKRKDRRVCF